MASLRRFIEPLQTLVLDCCDKQRVTKLLLFRLDTNLAQQSADGDSCSTAVFNLLLRASREG